MQFSVEKRRTGEEQEKNRRRTGEDQEKNRRRTGEEQEKNRRRSGEDQEENRRRTGENSSDSISEILVEMKKRNRGIRRAFLVRSSALLS